MTRLAAQVASLSALVSARSTMTVVHSGAAPSTSSALVLGGLGVSAALLLRLRGGVLLDDVMYVSRATFKSGVTTLGSGIQSVSAALARARAVLTERLDALSARVEDGLAAQAALAEDTSATRAGVAALGEQLAHVEDKLDGMAAKQEFACRGIYVLCSVVSQWLKESGAPVAPDALAPAQPRVYAKLPAAGGGAPAASLAELLGSSPAAAAGDGRAAAPHLLPLTGTLQEQLAAISSLAAVNLNLAAC